MRSVIPHSSSGTRYPENDCSVISFSNGDYILIGTTTVFTSCSLSEGVLTGIKFSESFQFASESGDVLTDSPFSTFWYGAVIWTFLFPADDEVLGVSVGVWPISVGREDSSESLGIARCPSFYVTTCVFPTVRGDLGIWNCESSSNRLNAQHANLSGSSSFPWPNFQRKTVPLVWFIWLSYLWAGIRYLELTFTL